MVSRLRSYVHGLFQRSAVERDLEEELRFHLESRTADLVASGVSPDEAARHARLEFGAVEAYKDRCRDARGLRLFDDLMADLRYAVRVLRRSPAFTLTAVLSLALGIGANTVVFSVVNTFVLKPLPVDAPDRLFTVQPSGGTGLSFPGYRDLRDRNLSLAGLVGYRIAPMNLEVGTGPVRAWGYLATGNYFDLLGIRPAIGRFFHEADDRREGDAPLAVLSFDCWVTRFGSDPGVVGRVVRINRVPFTVIGVAPQGFRGTELFYRPDAWVPMMMQPQIEVGNPWLENRRTWNTWVLARLKSGVTSGAALADINRVAAELGREYPSENEGIKLRLSRPGLVGDLLGGPVRAFTLGVLILAALVLLAACANLASVLAARGADRQRELAVRVSIGASRSRIVRQLLTETLLLAVAGGSAGCAVAAALVRALSAWHAPVDFPVQFDVEIDRTVLAFACLASAAAGLLFGLAPARQAARTDPNDGLRQDGGHLRVSGRRWPIRDVLVTVQVALSVVLLAACLLSLRGLQQALTMPLGIEPRDASMVGFDLGLAGYSETQAALFQQRALSAVAGLPGVVSAAYSNSLPLSIDQSNSEVMPDDRPDLKRSDARSAAHYQVSPRFFETLGIRRLLGRDFGWGDTAGRRRVAVVNATFARAVMRTGNPVGRTFRYGWGGDPVEIIGVVEDGKYNALTEASQPAAFDSILQAHNSTTTVVVRSGRPAEQLIPEIRQAIASLDPALPIYQAGTVEQMLGFVLFPSRAAAVALTTFGLLALVLAATGIHGLVAYTVSRRRREIGIRLAIGATTGSVLWLVLGRIAMLVGVGAVVGLALAVAAGRLLSVVVYQVSPHDPVVFGTVVGVIAAVGIASCWAPARRVMRVAPMSALHLD